MAEVIDNFPRATFLRSLGEPYAPYFAQTFKAPSGVVTQLEIELVRDLGPDDLDVRVLITEVSGSGSDFHPTAIVFESPTCQFWN